MSQNEKICISAEAPDMTSPVDPRFGRAAHLLLFDTVSGDLSEIAGAPGASHGAGVQAAQAVILSGARIVITGHLGPKAAEVLSAAGVSGYECHDMTVAEAIEHLGAGKLTPIKTS